MTSNGGRNRPPTGVRVRITEWSVVDPHSTPCLRGLSFDDWLGARETAVRLANDGVVALTETRLGLRVEARSFIGRLAVGPLDLSIEPKIPWSEWLVLVAFALQLRAVIRTDHLDPGTAENALEDLIILAFLSEARRLTARGLHRDYEPQRKTLPIIKGRLDMSRLVRRAGMSSVAVPIRFHRRTEDNWLNRLLLAGLSLASGRAGNRRLRADVTRLAHELHGTRATRPSRFEIMEGIAALDRRTRRYEPALRLIDLLWRGQGYDLSQPDASETAPLPGFAIDMNRIWQAVLSRLLREWSGMDVREEYSLRNLFQADPDYPLSRGLPRPRPDFAVFDGGRLTGYLDAKYRDLAVTDLPRDMLYQLAIYAMAQGRGTAAILYPTTRSRVAEERIAVRDPIAETVRGAVALRPVPLDELTALIRASQTRGLSAGRRIFALALIHGRDPSSGAMPMQRVI